MTYEVTRRPGALPTGRILVLEQSPSGAPDSAAEPIGCVVQLVRVPPGRVHPWIVELVAGRSWLEPTAAVWPMRGVGADIRTAPPPASPS